MSDTPTTPPQPGIETVRSRLRDSGERLVEAPSLDTPMRRLLDASTAIGAWEWDLGSDRVYANARFAEFYGVDPLRAAQGVPIAEYLAAVHGDDRERLRDAIDRAIATDTALNIEYRVLAADGGVRWVLAHGRCKYGTDGRPDRFPGAAVDITARRGAEQAQGELVTELQAEKSRLQAVLEHVPFGIVFAEAPSGRIIAGNRHAERILRHPIYDTPDIASYAQWVCYHEDGRTVQVDEYPLSRALLLGEVVRGEDYLYRRGDGSLGWVRMSATPIRDERGRVSAGVLSIVDVDDERRMQKRQTALGALNERLRDARDDDDIASIACEALGRALGASRVAFARIDDATARLRVLHDWCDLTVDSIVGDHPLAAFGEAFLLPLRQGRAYAIEDVSANPRTETSGSHFTALDIGAIVSVPSIAGGRLQAVLMVCDRAPRAWPTSDLSLIREVADRVWSAIARIHSAEALHDSELRFRTLTDSMPQMVWSTPPDGSPDYYNQVWYDFTGVPPGETDGEKWAQVLHPDDQARSFERWQHSVRSGDVYEIEYRLRRVDGGYRWVLARGLPMRDAAGRIVRWFGTCTDIDDQVRARELLSRDAAALEREVATRTGELQTALERLNREMIERESAEERLRQSQKMEAVGQLTGGIAHDFNNLMTGVIGGLSRLRQRVAVQADAELERYLDIAQTSAERAASLTHRLLAFSRRQSLDTRAVDVANMVLSMEELLRRTLGEHIRLDVQVAESRWLARADENQLENALLNLVINARDAMPHGGRLQISIEDRQLGAGDADEERQAGDYVALIVTDSGTGMPRDVIERAFDPFFTTKPIGQGTGLGLSMVYGFVRQIGGHVRIDSEEGRGTVVYLFLPRDSDREAAALPAVVAPLAAAATAPAGETILVVEDDVGVRALVVELLGELGYRVLEAADGVDGLALSAKSGQHIDLLLTDVGLPGVNGRQLAEAVRQHRPGLKVLFMTGYAEKAIERGGFLGEGMSMLTKPFTLDALARDVRRALDDTGAVT